jgi:hypothetical protein
MTRKTSRIIRRGPQMWTLRIYVGRDSETKNRNYISKTIHGGLRVARSQLNRMLAERDLCSLAQTTAHSRQWSEMIGLCCCTAEVWNINHRFAAIQGVQKGARMTFRRRTAGGGCHARTAASGNMLRRFGRESRSVFADMEVLGY